MGDKRTAPGLIRFKSKQQKIVTLTCYDFTSAQIAEAAGIDVILVGDSLGNVIQGHETTLPVTLEDICYHVACVAPAVENCLLVADMPFGTYNSTVAQAVDSAVELMRAGAGAVKLEGLYLDEIRAIHKAGIPVMGHAGLTPQSVHNFGGFKVQGKGDHAEALLSACKEIEEAGAFAVVLELVETAIATRISGELTIPTIGIGAGSGCDGQVQVWHDLLGLNESIFKHAKPYVQGRELFVEGIRQYISEVKSGEFPGKENSF